MLYKIKMFCTHTISCTNGASFGLFTSSLFCYERFSHLPNQSSTVKEESKRLADLAAIHPNQSRPYHYPVRSPPQIYGYALFFSVGAAMNFFDLNKHLPT